MTAIQSDISNLYAVQAKVELRFDRIERSIGLVAQPAE
jgi:hypothetical protein